MAVWHRISVAMFLLFSVLGIVQCGPDVSLVYKICNGDKFNPSDADAGSVSEVLQVLIDKTSSSGFNVYVSSDILYGSLCYGHGACNGALSHSDCDSCVMSAVKLIFDQCQYSFGAQIQLKDCRIRYESYYFSES